MYISGPVFFNVSCNEQILCPPIRWVSQGTLVSSTNKTDRHEITDISLKVELNTITPHNHLDLLQVLGQSLDSKLHSSNYF